MYKCEDNFLPNTEHTETLLKISDNDFPWYRTFTGNSSSPYFSHQFFLDGKPVSPHLTAFALVRKRLFTNSKYKLKDAAAFYFMQRHEYFEVLQREMFSSKNLTFLTYHLHNSDGNTIIPPINECFETKQNRAIFSKANLPIAETSPVKNGYRVILTATLEDL